MQRTERVRALLRQAGYRMIKHQGAHTRLEFWSGKKGTVIVQDWGADGCTTYADWPLGTTFEQLEIALG